MRWGIALKVAANCKLLTSIACEESLFSIAGNEKIL